MNIKILTTVTLVDISDVPEIITNNVCTLKCRNVSVEDGIVTPFERCRRKAQLFLQCKHKKESQNSSLGIVIKKKKKKVMK